jgi:hypothetical protein
MVEKRPKSSLADLINVYFNIKGVEYLKKISELNSNIISTESHIQIKQRERTSLLEKNQEILDKIKFNLGQVSQNTISIVESTKSIDSKLKVINETLNEKSKIQKQQLELQKQQNVFAEIQILQNEQQINLQKLSLLELELQSKIALKRQQELEKQMQLRQCIVTIQEEFEKIKDKKDNVTKFFLLSILKKNIERNNFNVNDLEEFIDKQNASNLLRNLEKLSNEISENFSEEEIKLQQDIYDYPKNFEKLNSDIKEIEKNFILKEQSIKKFKDNIDYYKNRSQYIESENKTLQEKIKNIEAGNYKPPTFKRPMIILTICLSLFLAAIFRLIYISSLGKTELSFWFIFLPINFLILFASVIFFYVTFNKTPERVKKKSQKKLADNNRLNYQNEIEKNKKDILNDEVILENIQTNLNIKRIELKNLINNFEGILKRYPEIKEVLKS